MGERIMNNDEWDSKYRQTIEPSVDEVDLPVLMSMVKDKLENPDRSWFLEVKLNAREWEKLVRIYYSQNEDDLQSMVMVAEDKAKKQGALEVKGQVAYLHQENVKLKKRIKELEVKEIE